MLRQILRECGVEAYIECRVRDLVTAELLRAHVATRKELDWLDQRISALEDGRHPPPRHKVP